MIPYGLNLWEVGNGSVYLIESLEEVESNRIYLQNLFIRVISVSYVISIFRFLDISVRYFFEIEIYRKKFHSYKKSPGLAKISSEKSLLSMQIRKNINDYVSVPTEPMTIHDSIIESIPYWFQGMLW